MEFMFGPEDVNWLAIIVAVVVYFILGWLWYAPLFGKAWAVEMGMDPDDTDGMGRGMLLSLIGAFLTAYGLRHVLAAFTPAYWHEGAAHLTWGDAAGGAFWTWLSFFVPVQLAKVAWEKRSWRLFAINAGYYLVGLILMAVILALWV